MSARIIAVANQKGGVAKSTTAVNLAAALADMGHSVTLIDADPQGTATDMCGVSTAHGGTLYTLLKLAAVDTPLEGYAGTRSWRIAGSDSGAGWDVVPADITLAEAEVAFAKHDQRETLLRRALDNMVSSDIDFVLIDCPPTLGLLTVNALAAADAVLVPQVPDYVSARGLGQLFNTVADVRRTRLNSGLRWAGVLFTRVEHRTHHQEMMASIQAFNAKENVPTFRTVIPEVAKAMNAAGAAVPLVRYDPKGKASVAYREAAAELIERLARLEVAHA